MHLLCYWCDFESFPPPFDAEPAAAADAYAAAEPPPPPPPPAADVSLAAFCAFHAAIFARRESSSSLPDNFCFFGDGERALVLRSLRLSRSRSRSLRSRSLRLWRSRDRERLRDRWLLRCASRAFRACKQTTNNKQPRQWCDGVW